MARIKENNKVMELNMTFGWELVDCHTTPSMFGRFLVHAGRYSCGGLNEEQLILVH